MIRSATAQPPPPASHRRCGPGGGSASTAQAPRAARTPSKPQRGPQHDLGPASPEPSHSTKKSHVTPRERIGRGWGQNRSSPCVRHRRMTHLQQPVPTGNTGGGRRALPTRPAAVGLSLPLSEPWLRADLVPSPPPALRFPSFRLECLRRAFAGRPAPQARARPAVTPGPGTAPRTGTARARQARLSESKPAQRSARRRRVCSRPRPGEDVSRC